ncbi:CHAT domain-containing protein [uncultured Aquimarina sp.]|uniref:CHAT domain-containing protein n=1 Tax=uncultured Aquimarina sp. TaxID=575652 RepID=UPI002635D563|nr:CHAT domain-containing protein [uncultured Aquimarina sp.]
MNPLKTIVLFLFFTSVTFSQTKITNDTILASQYFRKGDSLLTNRKLDSSIVYFKKALPVYKKAKVWERVAGCYNRISESQWRQRNLEESLVNAKIALELSNGNFDKRIDEAAYANDNIGEYYYSLSDYDNALIFYEKSLALKKENRIDDEFSIAHSYIKISSVYNKKSSYAVAIEFLKKSEQIFSRAKDQNATGIVLTYNSLGDCYNLQGEYKKAIAYFNKAIDIQIKIAGEKSLKMAPLYGNMAITYNKRGDYEKSLNYFHKALNIFIEKYGKDHPYVASTYNNIGGVYFSKGQMDKALEYLKKSLDIKGQKFNPNNAEFINLYYNLGVLSEHKEENDNALIYFDKALSICKQVYGAEHVSIARIYHSIGEVYQSKNEYYKALGYHKKGLEMYLSVLGNGSSRTAASYLHVGLMSKQILEFDSAIENYEKALLLFKNAFGEKNPKISRTYRLIGDCYNGKKMYNKALMYYEYAIIANAKDNIDITGKAEVNFNDFRDLNVLHNIFKNKTKTIVDIYKLTKDKAKLHESIEMYEKIDTLIDFIRERYTKYEDKLSFSGTSKMSYLSATEALLLLNQEIIKDKKALEKAFYYSEKSKSNTLKDLLNDTNAKGFSGLSTHLVGLEKDVRIDKAFYQSKVEEEFSKKEIDSANLSSYESKLFDISRRQDSLTEVLEKNYPEYHQLKYKNEVISVTDIQEKLNDKTTLLEFFTADSTTYAFTISKNKIAVKELVTPKLTEQIEKLRTTITDKNTKTYKTSSYRLYQQLIAPIEKEIVGEELVIVPDGPLWHLNFDLLLSKEDTSNNPKELSYLLKKYMISYANSATLLFSEDNNALEVSKKQKECLAFSFSDSTNNLDAKTMSLATLRGTGDDLPGTRKEIKAIADIIDGQYFYGSEAVEANFKKNASQYNILHLALHGEVDNERPENSRLFFTKNKDSIEDNLLYSHELFALNIPAELTVLSACNTGTGKIAKGEGIMSLGTAFQYAGTKSLLLSSWEVSDQTTPELMKYFYTNLKEGMSKAKALQQAKLQYLSNANLNRTQPFYWGGFYLVGDRTPIQFENNDYIYWLIGFGILGLILLSLFWYRRRNSAL